MKGTDKIITALNEALSEELNAINQYFLHAEMCEAWGFEKLAGAIKKQSVDEMKHAEKLIERILFLGGAPDMSSPMKMNVGRSVPEMLKNDLALEEGAVTMYNKSVKTARDEGDNMTAELFQGLLSDEEEHEDWLGMQLEHIRKIGLENYLALQVGEEE